MIIEAERGNRVDIINCTVFVINRRFLYTVSRVWAISPEKCGDLEGLFWHKSFEKGYYKLKFSENLKKFRLMKGVSTEELSGELGLRENLCNEWENEISEPNFPQLAALAIYFGCTADSLLGVD